MSRHWAYWAKHRRRIAVLFLLGLLQAGLAYLIFSLML